MCPTPSDLRPHTCTKSSGAALQEVSRLIVGVYSDRAKALGMQLMEQNMMHDTVFDAIADHLSANPELRQNEDEKMAQTGVELYLQTIPAVI